MHGNTDVTNANWQGHSRKLLCRRSQRVLLLLGQDNGTLLWETFINMNWATGLDANGRPISSGYGSDRGGTKVARRRIGRRLLFLPVHPETVSFTCSRIKCRSTPNPQGDWESGKLSGGSQRMRP